MSDRIAVVTGGAQGLGFAIAAELVTAGYHVVILGRRHDAAQAAADRLGNATAIAVDIGSPQAVTAAFARIDTLPGTLSLLVNNAGVFIPFPIEQAEDEWVLQSIATNLTGTVLCTREAVKRMKAAGETGDIVNVTSEGAAFPFPLLSVYCATKAGIEQFTKVLNSELRKTDIRLMTARVGSMKTEGAAATPDHKHIAQFAVAAAESGAMFQAGQGMDPASPARAIVAALATPRDARPVMIDIASA